MVEFTPHLVIALALALVVIAPQVYLSVLEARESQRYWAMHAPTACPQCQASYGLYRGQDRCISRLVTFEDAKCSSDAVREMEPFLGEREFVCKECGTLVVYERKQGPPIQLFVARPEDICRLRRCLDCNDVFLLSAHDKCPVCGGEHLKLDAD
jgi:rubrerythrin